MALSPAVSVSVGTPGWERPFSADTCLSASKVEGRRYYVSDVWLLVQTLLSWTNDDRDNDDCCSCSVPTCASESLSRHGCSCG